MDPSPDSLPPELQELGDYYAQANRSHLYQRCRRAELPVQPNWTREAYIAVLLGASYASDAEHVIDVLRDKLIGFIDEYWQRLQAQLKCPAKNLRNPDSTKVNRKPCYLCLDMQVVGCITGLTPQNQQLLYQIRRRT
jgi:hypothetical protein